jgi:hypothetical protein
MAVNNQEALDWLERGFDERDSNLANVGLRMINLTLRNEPRYQDLLRRMNFPEEVIATYLSEAQ